MLSHGIGRVVGYPDDVNPAIGGLEVYVVGTGATHGDEARAALVQDVHDRPVQGVVDEGHHHLRPCGQYGRIAIELALKVFDRESIGLIDAVKPLHVIGLGIKKCNFHRFTSLAKTSIRV